MVTSVKGITPLLLTTYTTTGKRLTVGKKYQILYRKEREKGSTVNLYTDSDSPTPAPSVTSEAINVVI